MAGKGERIDDECHFTLNGKPRTVESDVPLDMSVNTYLREVCNLRGTKYMCLEGGCGCCIVSLTVEDPSTGKQSTRAVNSCLLPVYSCSDKSVTTVEGLGSKKTGYSQEQRRLADFNGSQCGYCSPGMVMNMHCLQADKKVTMAEIENSFGGNICRCTGYRPILDAFKSMASDAPPELRNNCLDIEDITKDYCQKDCSFLQQEEHTLVIKRQGDTWYKPRTVDEIFTIFQKMVAGPYMLVGGNTAHGVYRRKEHIRTYIDTSGVDELRHYIIDSQLKLGGNVTLTDAISIFQSVSRERSSQFDYLRELAKHIDLIANVPVRNTGTVAGNLTIKHQHREFPSDVFLLLVTVGAKLIIASSRTSIQTVTLPEYLDIDMNKKIILSVELPPMDSSYVVRTYKIMPRAQNAHAHVNAGFCFKLNRKNRAEVMEKPRIVYGGISPGFIRAVRTEEYLIGKQIFNENVLKAAMRVLHSELNPDYVLPDPTPEYRKGLAVALFYKFDLSLNPPGLNKAFKSGGQLLTRSLSSGTQKYQVDRSAWPLNKPITKLEAHVQTSGEAEYMDDIPTIPGELFASLVLTKEGPGTIEKIDTSEVLKIPGVVAFYGADDIPGKNNFTKFTPEYFNSQYSEEIFCSGSVLYAGQPVGVLVANSKVLARACAEKVIVKLKNRKKPILTIKDALASGDKSRVVIEVKPKSEENTSEGGVIDSLMSWWAGDDEETHVVKGKFTTRTAQYHFHMETQTCICIPTEDGIDVYSSTQWMDMTNAAIAECLGVLENSINIRVRRMGGAYGAKISRSVQVACACALAAYKLDRPVRLILSIEQNMEAMGKRSPASIDYEVHCNAEGKISSLKADLFQNSGSNYNESSLLFFTQGGLKSGYDASKWVITGTAVRTDIPSSTYTRGPGSFEAFTFRECIMEHIALELDLDPVKLRLNNMDPQQPNIPRIVEDLRKSSNYDKRKMDVDKFNKENRWMKRGIALSVINFPIIYLGGYYSFVSIYHVDASVAVCHASVECGQGVNTKVAQVAAKFLGVDIAIVTVKPGNNLLAPNNMNNGGSIGTDTATFATMRCCQELMKRMEPVRKKLGNPTWKELVAQCYREDVDLTEKYMFQADDAKPYGVDGAAVAEILMDALTGQIIVEQVDILENAGISLNPQLDVGQIEGAFIMGLGCLTSEHIVHDPATGRLLTNRTWNYKPPGARDIPVKFNVELQGNVSNPAGVLRSKATGEPAVCLSCSVLLAIKHALLSARKDAGFLDAYFEMDAPATVEEIFLHSKTNLDQFSF